MNIRAYIDEVLERREESMKSLARRLKVDEGTLRKGAANNFQSTSAGILYRLAEDLGVSMEFLLGESGLDGGPLVDLPVRFVTGGGNWVEVERYEQTVPRTYEASPLPGVPLDKQWYEELQGDSINKIIAEGSLMQVVSHEVSSYKHGDIVIIERTRAGGHLLERSAKQVVFTSKGLEFWPRSTNPAWSEPVRLNDTPDDDTVSVQLAGIVKRAIKPFF